MAEKKRSSEGIVSLIFKYEGGFGTKLLGVKNGELTSVVNMDCTTNADGG